MKTSRIAPLRPILLGALLLTHAGLAQDSADLKKRADAARATADEMRFRQIPWVTDYREGFRIAGEEKRPVFLYMIVGDALDDC